MKKAFFKKRKLQGMKCWYECGKLAKGTFNFPNGDEIPICFLCAEKKAKTKRIKRKMMKYIQNEKQTILSPISYRENTTKEIINDNLGVLA